MARLKTFDNDQTAVTGEILPSDLNDMQDAYEEAFSTWKTIVRANLVINNATVAFAPGVADGIGSAFVLDDDDFATVIGTDRATVFRLKAVVAVNDVAPAADVQIGLKRITTVAAASGSAPAATATANAIDPAGADAAKAVTPAADSITVIAGNAVAIATAGLYELCAKFSAAPAAGSQAQIAVTLQMRQV